MNNITITSLSLEWLIYSDDIIIIVFINDYDLDLWQKLIAS